MSYYLEEDPQEEEPLITGICPNCDAAKVDWENFVIARFEIDEDGTPIGEIKVYKCPYCQAEIRSNNLKSIWSDDFTDKLADYLREDYGILETNNGWHIIYWQGRGYDFGRRNSL